MDNTAEPKKYSSISLVYSGIVAASKTRKLIPMDEILPDYNLDEAEHKALSNGNITLSFTDGPEKIRYNLPGKWERAGGKKIITSYIAFHAKASALSELTQFEKALDNLVKKHRESINDIYVIVPHEHYNNNYIKRRINDLPEKLSPIIARFTLLPYYYFNSNRLNHVSIGKVRIVPTEEVAEILTSLSAKKSNMPNQYRHDVVAVWLGAEEGDIVEQITPCEIGHDYVYLAVKE